MDTIPYSIISGIGDGIQNGLFSINYGNNKTLDLPINATAYNPTTPDVWELAREVTTFPYSEAITSEMTIKDNYRLPGKMPDGKDAVFHLVFDSDVILSAVVSDGENGKVALYQEGFDEQGGPLSDNYFNGLGTDITDCQCDFENGDLGNLDWVLEAPNSYEDWTVTTNNPHSGTYCMKSNLGCWSGNSSSCISFTRYVPYNITMSFWARISSETNCDKGYFFIDEVAKIDGISGDGDWIFYSYEVPQGLHTFKWEYTKDEDWCRNDDCFYVDDVFFWDAHTISLNCGLPIPQGSYYLLASSTSDEFMVNIDAMVIPVPEVPTSPMPVDGYNCYGDETVSLSWHLGDYTKEYQLLFGETNPPTGVLVDWTNELAENHDVVTESAKTYYWRVNERNGSGITEGPVWSFSTYRDIHVTSDSIIYVTPTGAGIKDGSSWANAASSIQAAIDAAADYSENQPMVWVSKGTYIANGVYQTGNGKTCCFLGHGGVKLYGGFNGDEPANYDLSQRDLENNATILDAESHCLVVCTQSSEWDGFVMQYGGQGCLYVYEGTSKVQNCKVLHSEWTGIFVDSGGLDCFHNEVSYHARDGISQNNSWDHLDIRDCTITYNERYGVLGNMCIRCKICNNGNGFYMLSTMGGALIGCLVANNDGLGASCDYIINSTIVNNGLGISEYFSRMDIVLCNSIVWGNTQQQDWQWSRPYYVSNNAIQGGLSGKNGVYPCINLSSDSNEEGVFPEFEHPSSGVGSAYTDGVWTLKANSPCINMGGENLSNIPEKDSFFCYNTGFTTLTDYLDYDLDGNQRIKQERIDIGAFESPYEKPNYQFPIQPDANNYIYVKENGQGNGSSWANATSNLQEALEASVLYDSPTTIWVAQGTYTVTDSPFQVKEHLKLYGGFEGNEPADYDLSQRDLVNHASVLDGNNTLRVLNQGSALSETTAAVADGFTIHYGNADNGAGAYLLDNMTLANCVLEFNTASDKGGGIYAENATVENCVVTNSTAQQGGGVYAEHSNIEDCFVTNNTAQQGGGMYASNSQIVQSHIGNNQASMEGGGLYVHQSDLLQCNILKNKGDGIYSRIDKQNECAHLYNTIVWGNDGESFSYSSAISIHNTYMSHCAIEGLRNTASGNIPLSHDNTGIFGPYFVDPVTETGVTESTGDWQLQEASLCINAGSNNVSGLTIPTFDLNKMERIQHGQVDLGVYESSFDATCKEMDVREATIEEGETYDFYGTSLNETGTYEHRWTVGSCDSLVMLYLRVRHTNYLFVSESGAGTKDGSSWANALDGNTVLESGYTKLADALQHAQCDDCFWVASGAYLPCGDSDASKHFILNEGVSVYGGFAGDETTLEERDMENNLTIFSGELQGDDNETNNTDGIFTTAPTNSMWSQKAILDGLTLTKGYTATRQGALLVNENTTAKLNQCRVQNNREGGIRNLGALEITNSELSNNHTYELGEQYMGRLVYAIAGALCNMDHGTVALSNCTFQSNYSENNGAIFNSGAMEIDATTFEDNTADKYGTILSPGKMKIHNTTFNNNRSEHYIAVMSIWDSLELVNCNITNNYSNYYTATHYPTNSAIYPSRRTSGIEAGGYSYVDHCNFINNNAGTLSGGALSVIGNADIANCLFRGNVGNKPWRNPETGGTISVIIESIETDGGALYVEGTATATDCVFEGNSGLDGSTIGVNGSLVMERCVIANSHPTHNSNLSSTIRNNHELTINNSLIVNNQDGFFQIDGIHTTLNNTTIANTSDELFILENLGESDRKSIIDFNNCIISGYSTWMNNIWDCQYELNMNNTLVSQQISGSEGNENDPLFVNPTTYLGYDENVNPLDFDWTLQEGSPCINAGDVTLLNPDPLAVDLAGEPRVKGGEIDMGAYEFGLFQRLTLSQGWNWIAPNLQTSVTSIQTALGDNLLEIQTKNGTAVGDVVPGEMVRIKTSTDCILTISGTRPASVTVSLEPHYNWFGFTGLEATAITTAFAGFNPCEGDKIVSQDEGFAIFENGTWNGTLEHLQPGQGYVYVSNAETTKTVTFGSARD